MIVRQSSGFFQSSKGLKPGDSLSPTLFVITADVLAKNLNKLFEDAEFKGFGRHDCNTQNNHLSYADDTILFYSGKQKSMRKMTNVLRGTK